ncbi:MAG TPA: DUF922 domain-containing protein [Vicinamibacterales bacterium]|nr:DUF922 domain-containing protein [Vicinamibacterales bacterium]
MRVLFPLFVALGSTGPTVSDRAAQVAVPDGAIVWSQARPLTWSDFKGVATRDLDGARSAISHTIAVGCRDGGLYVRVLAMFLPAQSWVTYRIVSSGLASRVGLQHEQIHFDIAELYARRMRKMYGELPDPCPQPDDALQKLADPLLRGVSATQRRYDDETSFGELEAVQLEWKKRVARELAELDAFQDRGEGQAAAAATPAISLSPCHFVLELAEGCQVT